MGWRIFLGFVLATALGAATQPAGDEADFSPRVSDPQKVLGSESCAKCHANEVQQWMKTPHYHTFESLHRLPEAKQIVDRLGLRSVKRNDTCIQCHYTQQQAGSRVRAISGVSCESCHGAAAEWITLHNDYGGPNATRDSESAQHREERRALSVAHGMNNPSNLYLLASQCLGCHTVPNENLVNVGGHAAGSQDFELVSWSQGMVRHNFLQTDGVSNAPSSPARLRVMYVVGVMADLEQSLRAVALATEKAGYGVTSAQRAARMKHNLIEIQKQIDDPHVAQALDAVAKVELRLNNGDAIRQTADEVGRAAYLFAQDANGENLAGIDPMLPDPSQYKN
jgi:hypothetical protein